MRMKRKTMRKGITEQIKPMPFWQSLIFFGIPALAAVVGQYVLWPFFMGVGVSEETAYHYQMLVVFTFLLSAALVAYVIEGNPLDWLSFRRRFRLFRLDRRGWKWTFGGLATDILLSLVATVLASQFYNILKFTPPDVSPSGPIMNLPLMAFVLFMNIISEELWWRGYILPRQEKQHGRYTWAIHGVLWAFFHAFKWWAVPFMLFTTWIIPFITQRIGNTTPGIIIHLVINGLGILLMV
jgi:membrane protease YdiL (CAAX protease family)